MKKEDFYAAEARLTTKTIEHNDRLKKIIRNLSKYNDDTVDRLLDVGCGDGDFTMLLKKVLDVKEVYGIDISPKAVEIANKKGFTAVQVDIDAEKFSFEDGYFDIIVCGEVIEHLFDPDHLLDEIYRVLKRKGICLLTTPNLAAWYNRVALLLGYQPYKSAPSLKNEWVGKLFGKEHSGGEHIRHFTTRALKDLIKEHNFRIKYLEGAHANPSFSPGGSLLILKLVLKLEKIFSKFPSLASDVIIIMGKDIKEG